MDATKHASEELHERARHATGNGNGAQPHRDDETDQWPTAPLPPTEWPDAGEYEVAFRRGRVVVRFARCTADLSFEILHDPRHGGVKLPMYFALPRKGACSPKSKYYRHWTLANGGPPARGDRMTPNVFHGVWLAEVVRSSKDADGSLPEGQLGPPVIQRLIRRLTGGPRR